MATRVHGLGGWLVFAALLACAPTPPSLPAAETGDASSSDAGVDAASDGGGTTGETGTPACEADSDCDDGEFCNGAETCMSGVCIGGQSRCSASELCDETLDACEPNCDVDGDGEASIACGGTDCNDDDDAVGSMATEICDAEDLDEDCDPTTTHEQLLGSWAHCSACLDNCGPQAACEAGSCIPARRVFITSTMMDGAFGGAEAADDTCQQLAVDAGLGGSWLAYLVDSDNGLDRHQPADVAYVRMDGVRIAEDWIDLTDGNLLATLNVTESGEVATSEGIRPSNAWTGLAQVSGQAPNNCDDWTYTGAGCLEGSPCGAAGEPDAIDDHWDGFFVFQCEQLFRLYCIEQ